MALNEDEQFVPKSFSIRPGTVDYGKEYEVKIAALLSLRCVGYKMMESMWLAMNVDECGAFDDIILYIQTQNGKKITYLIQLKHKMEPNDIGAREFKTKKGDFFLEKYCDTVAQIKNATDMERTSESEIINHLRYYHEATVFILFTNRGTTENDFLKNVEKSSTLDNTWLFCKIIDTNGKISLFDYDKLDFKVEDKIKSYMEKFFLFTKQIHINKLNAAIEVAIENLIKPLKLQKHILKEIVQKYVLFITDWSKGELGGYYPLTKNLIFKVLLEHMVAPYSIKFKKPEYDSLCHSHNVWNKVMEEKTVTIIEFDDVVMEFLNRYIYCAVKNYCEMAENKNLWKRHPDMVSKIILRTTGRSKEVQPCDAYECLWKLGIIPLLLTVSNSQDFNNLFHFLGLFQTTFRVIVLVKGEIDLPRADSKTVLKSINDLNQDHKIEILKYPVQLQGRLSIKLLDFVNEELLQFITVRYIIYILSGVFNVGNMLVSLPETFVERSLEKVWLKPKVLQEISDEMFVVKCNPFCDFKIFLSKHQLQFSDSQVCEWNNIRSKSEYLELRIIKFNDEDDVELVNNYCLTNTKTIHYLILHDEDTLEWVKSFNTIKNITNFRKNSNFSHLELKTTDKVMKEFVNKTILISACPGMGKSILMDYIALNTPTDMWVFRINLFEYVDYYKSENFENLEPSQHLQYFANRILKEQNSDNNLGKAAFQKYLDSKKILLLLDGYDEIPMSCQENASKMIKDLHNLNYCMYVTTRPILKIHLEELIDTFAVTINSFTRTDQSIFLTKYYVGACDMVDVKMESVQRLVKLYVRKLLNATKQNLNDQDQEFTGVPLQTKLLAEVFAEGCKKYIQMEYFENLHFDLLYLYKHFIEQKFKIVCAKFGNSSDDMLHHYKTYRSLYALRLLFAKRDLEKLNLEGRLKQVMQFFPNTLQHLQKDGIVVVERESNVTFVHRTFAEYLTAQWLSENINTENRETVQTLIKRTFDPNFATVRNIFDRILASDCPLHLAVINRRLDTAKKIIISNETALVKTDRANRSFLHLIAAWGVYHPFTIESFKEIKVLHQIVVNDSMLEMLKLIPNKRLRCSKDDLLHYTQLDYAILSSSLNVADAICARLENVNECMSLTDININYSLYFKHFPYGSLGSILIRHSIITEMNTSIQQRTLSNNVEDELHYEIIHGDILKASLLLSLGKDINKKDVSGFTPLHIAAMSRQILIAQLLISNQADVGIKDNSCKTALHWATMVGELKIVTLLLSNGIDVNAIDNNGMNALHYAIVTNTTNPKETLSVLLKNNASITIQDNYGKTPLHYALHYNQIEILKLLLNCGADIDVRNEYLPSTSQNRGLNCDHLSELLNSRDFDGGTVLHWAADKGFTNIVSLFLSYGAPVQVEDDDRRTALHWAAERGQNDVVTLLLSNKANVNAKDNADRTPLFFACDSGNVNTIKLLITKGANVQDTDNLGRTPLLHAMAKDFEQAVTILLSSGSYLDQKDNENTNALHWAAWNGNTNVAKLLVIQKQHLSLEEKNSDGRTALILAGFNGHTDVINLLLRNGADLSAIDKQNMNAVHWASWNGHLDALELLLLKTSNLEVKDEYSRTPLICAAYNGYTTVVNLLLLNGANVEAEDNQCMTALNWAAYNGHVNTINLLITKGSAKLETTSKHGRTALINAANSGHTVIVNMLLVKGVDIEAADKEGMNSLHCAACKGHINVVKILLDKGANLEAKSKHEKTALIYAADYGYTTIVLLLLSKGADIEAKDNENMSVINWAAHNGHTDIVNLLVNIGANLEIKNRHGRTALIIAAQNGHVIVVNLLIFKKANMESQDNSGMGALHWAAYNGNTNIVNLFLGNGLTVDLKDGDGRTSLVHAAYNGHKDLVTELLFKGANIDETDVEDMTAMHWASINGHREVVELLLSEGANLERKDKYNSTALIHAVSNGHFNVVAILLAKGANIEVTANENKTALHFAALKGYKNIAEVLLAVGADIEAKDECGRTVLMYSATAGDVATAALFISRGANPNAEDEEGLTALDWAKRNNQKSTELFLQRQVNFNFQSL